MTREQRFTFDEVAELYDRHRPGYPEALFEDLVALSGLAPAGRILEIGAGTGQATRPLARRGFRVLCLEPGAALARVARRKLAEFPRVEVLETNAGGGPSQTDVATWVDTHQLNVTTVTDRATGSPPETFTTLNGLCSNCGVREQAFVIDLATMTVLFQKNGSTAGIGDPSVVQGIDDILARLP